MKLQYPRRAVRSLVFALVALVTYPLAARATTITVSGSQFAIDGLPQFLVFVSYFGALRHSDSTLELAFAYLSSVGVRGIRVFPNWWQNIQDGVCIPDADTLMLPDSSGALSQAQLERLHRVIDLADRNGIVVDVSFAIEPVPEVSYDGYRKALLMAYDSLGRHPNVIVDLQNEFNLAVEACRKPAISPAQMGELLHDLRSSRPAGTVPIITVASADPNVHGAEAGGFAETFGFDAVAYHDPRRYPTTAYPGEEACAANSLAASLKWVRCTCQRVNDVQFATARPVYLQEPGQSNLVPPADPADAAYSDNYLLEAVARAKASGAAAWTLHTEGGFAFHTSDQPPAPPNLTLVEADFLERLDHTLAGVPWNVGCP